MHLGIPSVKGACATQVGVYEAMMICLDSAYVVAKQSKAPRDVRFSLVFVSQDAMSAIFLIFCNSRRTISSTARFAAIVQVFFRLVFVGREA